MENRFQVIINIIVRYFNLAFVALSTNIWQ